MASLRGVVSTVALSLSALCATPALAKVINLVCVSTDDKPMSMNFRVDTTVPSVAYSGLQARNVFIDEGEIAFTLDLGRGAYFHSINRSTGMLLVRDPNGAQLYGYHCEPARPKF